ncbi:Protein involved in plasmid maintenance/nuclear protein involved in lipid metabolism [Ceraceosorus bombacis]|uniref:phosphatidate phosphatase n=1 Tax=Ceraceosorus bombacis TaxID=401625 RepID=A0A0P1BDG1_9BASI|nr:Protein involved in plasmid maintenance/nuclear protein involved in lipid metabolism [Ceraceosorus bombacis]
MQYVGRLVSSVYNSVPSINPATLSGAIDIIVVERQIETEEEVEDDGSSDGPLGSGIAAAGPSRPAQKKKRKVLTTELSSTPFHVRFGKMSVLRPAERKVTLHLNNSADPLPFAMKVGEAGEAFFVLELNDEEAQGAIPDDLVTSPILSPATSPDLAGNELDGAESGAVAQSPIEALDLGASVTMEAEAATLSAAEDDAQSQTTTIQSNETADTGITIPNSSGTSTASAEKRGQSPARADASGDHGVNPEAADAKGTSDKSLDSGKGGSGRAGAHSTLGQVTNAAAKAGGALGAAGKAVVAPLSGSNAKLESVRKRQERQEPHDSAPLSQEESGSSASPWHTTGERSDGKERLQQQDDDAPPDPPSTNDTETEKLEQVLKKRAEGLVQQVKAAADEESFRAPSETPNAADEREEAYPAPFDAIAGGDDDASEGKGLRTRPTAQLDHADYLGGERMPRIKTGTEDVDLSASGVDPSTLRTQLDQQRHIHRHEGTDKEEVEAEAGEVREENVADKPPGSPRRKEDLQYMLDMDGYHMTSDGESLAYSEAQRLAKEVPLSKRHGGAGRHSADLFHHDRSQSTELLRKAVAEGSRPRSASRASVTDSVTNSDGDSTSNPAKMFRRGSHSGASEPRVSGDAQTILGFRNESSSLGGDLEDSLNSDQLSLSRDLVRLTRMMRSKDDPVDEAHFDDPVPRSDARTPRPARNRGPSKTVRRHFQDTSLSDTEADAPNWSSNTDYRAHQRATRADTEFGSKPERSAPNDQDRFQSSDYDWEWGQIPKVHDRPRARVTSLDAEDVSSTSRARGIDLERGDLADDGFAPTVGRLTATDEAPYDFCLVLNDASHRFELSLCYHEGFDIERTTHVAGATRDEPHVDVDAELFDENRVSFQRFMGDPDIVNDERLVVRYNERFMTWENASAVLATLSLCRKTMSAALLADQAARTAGTSADAQAPPQAGERASVWSRLWNRKRTTASAADLEAVQSASAASEDQASLQGGSLRFPPAPLDRSHTDSELASGPAAVKPSDVGNDAAGPAIPMPSRAPKVTHKTYAKTLRLSSDQLKSLNLRKGANKITFSVTSSYSGVATCTARIFLWEASHRIVVSDIDGTITKSDALGHVFTMIGRDWTHVGVAKLYTDIARNGYRIMYLTSRAIGQADATRDYLRGIRQTNYQLPDGPVIMSPDRLIASLHREVILRKPEVFKMACLRDIARLFGHDPRATSTAAKDLRPGAVEKSFPGVSQASIDLATGDATAAASSPSEGAATASDTPATGTLQQTSVTDQGPNLTVSMSPFYAGFGNRITDALSYRSVNIPSSRIFTIDSNGEVKMELLELAGYKSSYIHMTDLVDQMFPPITVKSEAAAIKPEYNDFNFWRPSLSTFELPPDDELMPTPPVSPALSARSGRSVRSNASLRSATTDTVTAKPDEEPRRRSRFGLGSLGLSRKGSAQTIDVPDQTSTSSAKSQAALTSPSAPDLTASTADGARIPQRSESDPDAAAAAAYGTSPTGSSYGSGANSSWIAPWRRRRAASPGETSGGASATSPLVGPVITAEPDSDEENVASDDDDVSVFGDGQDLSSSKQRRDEEDEGEDDEEEDEDADSNDEEPISGREGARRRDRARGGRDEEVIDDDLLAGGEIRFDWR